jgi:DNA polymerase-1
MSAFRLARDLKMPRKDAESFIRIYFERYSGIDRFIKDTIRQAEEKGYVETIKGRRRALPRINSLNKTEKRAEERIAVNTPIQGSAADIVKMAMIEVSEGLSRKGYKTRLILQVHDELIFEAPEEEVKEAGEFIRNIMEQIIDLGVPLRVNIEKGGSWGDIH